MLSFPGFLFSFHYHYLIQMITKTSGKKPSFLNADFTEIENTYRIH